MLYYDREGSVISMKEWGLKSKDKSYQTLAYTEINGDEITVSTIWLGIDHGFPGGRLLIFETTIFGGEHNREMRRYSTQEEAMEGHEEMVRRATAHG